MEKGGIQILANWDMQNKNVYGGCIDRKEVAQLRDFLNKCIEKWENENN